MEKPKDRLVEAESDLRTAWEALRAGDVKGCGWRARHATEQLLLLLAEHHAVEVHGPGLNQLRQDLVTAGRLRKSLVGHVQLVQEVGNRAAHAQPQAADTVQPTELESVLSSVDHLLDAVHLEVRGEPRRAARRPIAPPPPPPRRTEAAPPPLPPPDPPREAASRARPSSPSLGRTALLALLAIAAVPVAPAVTFVATTRMLAWTSPPPAAPPPPPTAPEAAPGIPLAGADAEAPAAPLPSVEALPANEGSAVILGPEATVRAARAGQPLEATWLVPLDCAGLAATHDAVWARAAPGRTLLDATDRSNLARVRALLDARRCPCPDAGGPCAP